MNRRQLLSALALPALPAAAKAAGAGLHYSARLIGGETQGGIWRAGLDITLDKGWKTYWRMPGDAGVPPAFDWSRSINTQSLTVLWPAPKRLIDAGGEAVGYKDRIVFPFDIKPKDESQPVKLKLAAFFGVCEIICIPARLEASLVQAAAAPADASLIAAFAARVPQRVDGKSPFRVAAAKLVELGDKFALALTFAGDGFGNDLDIFVEGSDLAYFRAPQPTGDQSIVHVPINGLKDMAVLKGRRLTLTMVAGDIRLEQDVVVD